MTDDTITTAGAIGFAVTSGTVKVAVVRPSGLGALDKTSYFGMEVSLAGASLVGVEGLTFKATGTVLVNRATDAAGAGAVERINWATATDTASALPVFSAKLTKLVELQVDGSVSLGAFGFVVGTSSFSLTKATADVTTGNAALGTAGLLSGARLLSITLTNVNLFAGWAVA